MGMSIDDVIRYFKDMEKACCCGTEQVTIAIETMRKYQKIAELYDYWRSGKCEYTISCMENIGKVLRDGKND